MGEKSIKLIEKILGENISLGKAIRAIREFDEISIKEFSGTLGISESELSDIETRKTIVKPGDAKKFSLILGFPEDQFIRLSLLDYLRKDAIDCDVKLILAENNA